MANSFGSRNTGLSGRKPINIHDSEEEKLRRLLIRDPTLPPTRRGDPVGGQLEYGRKVATENIQRGMDAENIQHLLPDVNMAKHLLVSTILSPKDLISVNLIYTLDTDALGEVGVQMLRVLEQHLDEVYKIKQKLPEMLRAILFEDGSYCVSILPKSAIDDVIQGKNQFAYESMMGLDTIEIGKRNLGYIGNPGKMLNHSSPFSNESLVSARTHFDPNIAGGVFNLTITDNPDSLKMQRLRSKHREDFTQKIYREYGSLSVESALSLTIRKNDPVKDKSNAHDNTVFQQKFYKQTTVLDIRKSESEDVYGYNESAFMRRHPAAAIVPIHVPSDPTAHLGYLVLLDTYGNDVRKSGHTDIMRQAMSSKNGAGGGASQMLDRMRNSMTDFGQVGADPNAMYAMYSEIIQNEIKERLKNGSSGEEYDVAIPDEIVRVMFARSCSQMHTQMVYVPKMYMSYFALKYDDRGVGISLVESTKMLATLRGILLLSSMFGSIKNSINYKKLGITLSPKDPDPDDTVESAVTEFARATQYNLPIMEPNAESIVSYLQNAGTQVEVKGHPRYPETEITVDHIQNNNVAIDNDFSTKMQEIHMQGLNVPPEAINTFRDVNYATSILQSNLMFSKNAMQMQDEFTPQLTSHVRQYTMADGKLLGKLRDVVKANREKLTRLGVLDSNTDEAIVSYFVANVLLGLPKPDLTQLETQLEAFKVFQDGLDQTLPMYISADILSSGIGDQLAKLGITVDNYTAIIKAQLCRDFLAQNNIMPQLFDLVGKTKEDQPGFDFAVAHTSHVEGLLRMLTPLTKVLAKESKELGDMIDKSGLTTDGSDSGGENDSDTGGGESGDEGLGGDDDFASGGGGSVDMGDPFADTGSGDQGGSTGGEGNGNPAPEGGGDDESFDANKAEKDAENEEGGAK